MPTDGKIAFSMPSDCPKILTVYTKIGCCLILTKNYFLPLLNSHRFHL